MWNSIAKLIKQCCFLTDGTLVGDKWYIGSESRDRVAAPWNGSLHSVGGAAAAGQGSQRKTKMLLSSFVMAEPLYFEGEQWLLIAKCREFT